MKLFSLRTKETKKWVEMRNNGDYSISELPQLINPVNFSQYEWGGLPKEAESEVYEPCELIELNITENIPTEQQKSNDPYSPYAAWITPQQVYEAQQKQKNAESVDDICIKCKHHGTFDVYCDECTDTNDNYQPKTKEE